MKIVGVGQDGGDDLAYWGGLEKFSSELGLKGRWEGAWEYTLRTTKS